MMQLHTNCKTCVPKHVFHTNAIFGFRDAGKDILKITSLVKLALISFMDVIYQSYVKLHWVIFIM